MSTIKTDVNEFLKFHELLMQNALKDYVPHYIKVARNKKGPGASGSHTAIEARLTVSKAVEWLKTGGNIGLCALKNDPLVILDVDDLKKINVNIDVKKTLSDISSKRIGKHFYYFSDSLTENIVPEGKLGEIRCNNYYAITPGSFVTRELSVEKGLTYIISENKNNKSTKEGPIPKNEIASIGKYTIETYSSCKNISLTELPKAFRDHVAKVIDNKKYTNITIEQDPNKSALYDLKVTDIIGQHQPKERFPSVLHSSGTGKNTSIDETGSLMTCWNHGVTMNAIQLLAALEYISRGHDSDEACKLFGKAKNNTAGNPSELNQKDNESINRLWEFAKKEKIISANSKMPYRAYLWLIQQEIEQLAAEDNINTKIKKSIDIEEKILSNIYLKGDQLLLETRLENIISTRKFIKVKSAAKDNIENNKYNNTNTNDTSSEQTAIETENLLVHHSDDGGISFYRQEMRTRGRSQHIEDIEIIFISNIEILKSKHHDVIKKKISNKTFCSLSRGEEKFEFCIEDTKNFADLSTTIIEKFNVSQGWKSELSINVPLMTNFIKNSLEKIFKKEIKTNNSTTHCGIFTFDRKTLLPLFPYNSVLKGQYTITELNDVEYEDKKFEKLLTDEQLDKLKQTLNIINNLGTTDYGKNIICNVLSLSLASVFRVALFDLGLKLFPYICMIGSKEEGKSFLMEIFVQHLWNNMFLENNEIFKGTSVRFKAKVIYTTRPLPIDEIQDIHKNYRLIPIIKTGATSRLGAKIPRGQRDGTIINLNGIRPFFLTANSLMLSDSATESRLYVIPLHKDFRKNNMHDISEQDKLLLEDHANTIGQAIIHLTETDPTIITAIKTIFKDCNKYSKLEHRDKDKLKVLLVGEMLMKKVYDLVSLDYMFNPIDMLTGSSNIVVNEEDEDLTSCMNKLLTMELSYVADDISMLTLRTSAMEVIMSKDLSTTSLPNNLLIKFAVNGIYFTKQNEIVLYGKNLFKARLNAILKYKIATMKSLEEKLSLLGQNTLYINRHNNPSNLTYVIDINSKIKQIQFGIILKDNNKFTKKQNKINDNISSKIENKATLENFIDKPSSK